MKKLFIIVFTILVSSALLSANHLIKKCIPLQDTIVGYFEFEQLKTAPYDTWFETEYESYTIDTSTLDQINIEKLDQLDITVVIGTWCHDSQRETPRLVKIFDYLKYDTHQIKAIGVNRNKEAKHTDADNLNIEFVPTIIFFLDGNEIGRIIETPEESLEKDILNIISNF